MNRQSFKERMKSLKSYREENPGKGYWDWKVLALWPGGTVEREPVEDGVTITPSRKHYVAETDAILVNWPALEQKIKRVVLEPVRVQPVLSADNRTEWKKQQDRTKGLRVAKVQKDAENEEKALKALTTLALLASPSTYIGPVFNENGENYVDAVLSGEGTGNILGNIALDAAAFGAASTIERLAAKRAAVRNAFEITNPNAIANEAMLPNVIFTTPVNKTHLPTSLKFYERPTLLSDLEKTGIPKGERNFAPRTSQYGTDFGSINLRTNETNHPIFGNLIGEGAEQTVFLSRNSDFVYKVYTGASTEKENLKEWVNRFLIRNDVDFAEPILYKGFVTSKSGIHPVFRQKRLTSILPDDPNRINIQNQIKQMYKGAGWNDFMQKNGIQISDMSILNFGWDEFGNLKAIDVDTYPINGYKNGGMVPAYTDGTDGDDDHRTQIINRANEVASNYDNAKDFDLNSIEYNLRKLAKNWFGRGGISNCTLSATGWIDPNNQYMSARNIFNNPNSGYVEIDKEYALPGDLLISKNPEKDSYHTMLIEGFNDNEPLLRYSRGGHDTEENLVKGRPLTEYHRLDNEQGGNHTEDHYFRYMLPNEFWLPEVTIFSDKVNVPTYGDGGDIDLNTAVPKASQEQIDTELSNALLHSIRKGHKDSIKTFMSRGEYVPEPYTYPDAGNIDYAFNLLDILPTPNLGVVGKISNNLGLKHMMNYRKYGIKSKYWDELDNILKLADKDGIQIPGDRLEWALKQTENFKKFAGDDYIEGYMGIRNPFDPKWVGRKWIASKDRALGYTWSKKQVMKEGDVGIVPVVTPKPKNIKEYNAQGRNWTNVDGYKSTDELAGSGSVKYTNVRDDGPHTLRDVAETEYTFPFDHPTKVIVGNNGDFNPHINDMYGVVKNESGQFNPLPLTLAIQQKRAEQKEKQKKNKKRSN